MSSSRTQAGKAHENGDVEAHHRLKRAIEQELRCGCSRDFIQPGRVAGELWTGAMRPGRSAWKKSWR